jgi:hypothetical protein
VAAPAAIGARDWDGKLKTGGGQQDESGQQRGFGSVADSDVLDKIKHKFEVVVDELSGE